MSELVRRSRLNVGPCSARSVLCREVFGEVGLKSGLVRRSRVFVGTCSAKSA